MEEMEPSYTAEHNVKYVSIHHDFSIYPPKVYTLVLIALLFTTAPNWKETKCS
jgi:hypothetical protein